MKRAIIREYDQWGENLSGHCARFSYRLMNLCVKAEEVALLPIEVMSEGEPQKLEQCCSLAKKGDYSFMVVPKFEEDLPAVAQGVMMEHPEFKQKIQTLDIDSVDAEGKPKKVGIRYLLLTMPEVNNERYDVLKNGVDALYNECKVAMELANTKFDMKLTSLLAGESQDDLDKLKKERDRLNTQWTEHRDKIYNDKVREIEMAHNLWMADRVEETLNDFMEKETNSDTAAFTMRLNPEDYE